MAWAKRWGVPVVHWTAYFRGGSVDALCPVSEDLGRAVQKAVPAMNAQVHVVPNVVNTDLFRPADPALLAGVPVGATRRRMEGRGMERLLDCPFNPRIWFQGHIRPWHVKAWVVEHDITFTEAHAGPRRGVVKRISSLCDPRGVGVRHS